MEGLSTRGLARSSVSISLVMLDGVRQSLPLLYSPCQKSLPVSSPENILSSSCPSPFASSSSSSGGCIGGSPIAKSPFLSRMTISEVSESGTSISKRRVSADVDVELVVGRRLRCWWKRLRRTLIARLLEELVAA